MVRWLTVSITCLLFALSLSHCTRIKGIRADASGFGGAIEFGKLRPRCQFKKGNGCLYDVVCQAVVSVGGQEVRATSLPEGLALNWSEPERLDGGEISVEGCTVDSSDFSEQCSICLKTSVPSKVRFGLVTTEIATQRQAVEEEIVHLPFSVESFGRVSSLLPFYSQAAPPSPDGVNRFGLQNLSMPATDTYVGRPTSLCTQGERFYFSTQQNVYVVERDQLRLFAGSSNPANGQEYSDRLRVGFSKITDIACGKDAIYVLDSPNRQNAQVLKVPEEGRVNVVIPRGTVQQDIRTILEGEKGSLYFTDGHALYKLGASGERLRIAGESFTNRHAGDGGPAIDALLSSPRSLAWGKDGSLYVAEDTRIRRIDRLGNISLFAGNGGLYGLSRDGMPAIEASLGVVDTIAISPQGELYLQGYIGDFGDRYYGIRKISSQGNLSTVVRLSDASSGIAVEASGSVLVVDGRNQIKRLVGNHMGPTVAGTRDPLVMTAGTTYESTTAQFGHVSGVAIGPDDSIYAVDSARHQVFRIDPNGSISVFAGTGTLGDSGEGNEATLARFNGPSDILIANNKVYVADTWNRKIRQIVNGTISTVVHSPEIAPLALGLSETGRIYFSNHPIVGSYPLGYLDEANVPHRVTSASYSSGFAILGGKVLFSDGERRVSSLNPSTAAITPFAGSNMRPGFAGDGGLANLSLLSAPARLVRDGNDIYIADTDNGRIRRAYVKDGAYRIETFLGGESKKDCSGAIKRKLTPADMEREIQSSLSTVCYSKPLAFAIRKYCGANEPNRHITMALSQSFGETSNVMRIRRPCP